MGVGQRAALVIGHDLVRDAFGGSRRGVVGVEHIHRDGGELGFAGGQGAALPVADFDARGGGDGGDGLQHIVFAHAGQERFVQGGVVAHVVADQQGGGVEVLQGSGHDHLVVSGAWGARFVCLLALEIPAGKRRESATVRARSSLQRPGRGAV